MSDTSNYWISWYSDVPLKEFEYHGPWWISGYEMRFDKDGESDDRPTVCAAVVALDQIGAEEIVRRAYDNPPDTIRWRFCEARPKEWEPFSDRFPRAAWMKWPHGVDHRLVANAALLKASTDTREG